MANKNNNRKCVICNKIYSFCPNGCAEDKGKPAWMAVFDSENCKDIYYTCVNAEVGNSLTKAEAKKRLKKLDLSNVENFNPVVKSWIEDITGEVFSSGDDYAITQEEQAEG